jgi:hypothetical protein
VPRALSLVGGGGFEITNKVKKKQHKIKGKTIQQNDIENQHR